MVAQDSRFDPQSAWGLLERMIALPDSDRLALLDAEPIDEATRSFVIEILDRTRDGHAATGLATLADGDVSISVADGAQTLLSRSGYLAIDRSAPEVTRVSVPAAGSYAAGSTLRFVVEFSESVAVSSTGTATLGLSVNGGTAAVAQYDAAASSDTRKVFTWTPSAPVDSIVVNTLTLAGGATITDRAGNALATQSGSLALRATVPSM
ncbi:MAG: Ig-like domain-containing protein, partial [Phycisphaerales bacterium]